MSETATFPQTSDGFTRGVWVSLGVHVGILLLFLVKNLVFPPAIDNLPPAVRVDLVGLPDKIQTLEPPAAKPAEPAEAPPPEKPAAPEPKAEKPAPPKKDDAIKLTPSKDKAKAALDKLKTMAALDKIKDDVSKERTEAERKRLDALAEKARAGAKIKGNILAPGTSLTGIDRLQHDQYAAAIDHHVKPFWQTPQWLKGKGLKARVLVKFDARGNLISRQLVQGSGNPDFDQSAIETVDRAAPLPAPPEKFVAIASVQGIYVDFGE